jgi:hypothetical protein
MVCRNAVSVAGGAARAAPHAAIAASTKYRMQAPATFPEITA